MRSNRKIDDFLLLHRRGELPPHLEPVAVELASTPEGLRRMAELAAMEEEVIREFPPEQVTREIRRRLGDAPVARPVPASRRTNWWIVGVALAVAVGGLALGIGLLIPIIPKDTHFISGLGVARPTGAPPPVRH